MIHAIPGRVKVCERSTVDPTSSPEFFPKSKVGHYSLAEPPRCMNSELNARSIGSERERERLAYVLFPLRRGIIADSVCSVSQVQAL